MDITINKMLINKLTYPWMGWQVEPSPISMMDTSQSKYKNNGTLQANSRQHTTNTTDNIVYKVTCGIKDATANMEGSSGSNSSTLSRTKGGTRSTMRENKSAPPHARTRRSTKIGCKIATMRRTLAWAPLMAPSWPQLQACKDFITSCVK